EQLTHSEIEAPAVAHGVMEAHVDQERISSIDEHGDSCERALDRKDALDSVVDPALARHLGVRVTSEVDELELSQLGTDTLNKLAVPKFKTQSQCVVSQVGAAYALTHSLQIHCAVQTPVGHRLRDREIRIARTDSDDVALITR